MIADKIKELREANSMTQNEVAKRLGITRSSVIVDIELKWYYTLT